MDRKKALITGITGQDGSHLADFLLERGYEVHGIIRRSSTHESRARIDHWFNADHPYDGEVIPFFLHYGNLQDPVSIEKIIRKVVPDEVYNLAAQSHVGISFEIPDETLDINAAGAMRILEAIRKICPHARFYQASSSEMFGKVLETPQTEKTPFNPQSPYAQSKVIAFNHTTFYRRVHGIFACNGILFNHEGERRGYTFVTRKITSSLARIKMGIQKKLVLGNMDAERDWGYAPEYIRAMWMILQQERPDDYVIGTGEKHTVREFLEKSAEHIGLKIYSNGKSGVHEKYLDENGNVIVEISPKYFRPAEVDLLIADPTKAKSTIGWEPLVKFSELVKIMCEEDMKIAEKEAYIKERERKNCEANLNP